LEFLSVLAWPLVVIVAVIILRAEIKSLGAAMSARFQEAESASLSGPGFSLTVSGVAQRATTELAESLPVNSDASGRFSHDRLALASASPLQAVEEAYDRVQESLRLLLAEAGERSAPESADAASRAAILAYGSLIPRELSDAVAVLTNLRNTVLERSSQALDQAAVTQFLQLAEAVLSRLETPSH
jgi:hypothetical protein